MAIVDVSRIPNNSKFDPVREAILELEGNIISGVAGVASLNGQTGSVNIVAGDNITVSANNGSIVISSTGGSGTLDGALTLNAGDGIGLSSPSVFDGSADLAVTITNTDRPNDGQLLLVAGAGIATDNASVYEQEVLTWDSNERDWIEDEANIFSANATDDLTFTIRHANTSDITDKTNTNGNVIQSMTFDEFGHVKTAESTDLDTRYLAFRTIFTEDDGGSLVASSYNDTLTLNGSPSISVTTDTENENIYFALSLNDISFDRDGNLIARGLLYYQEVGEPAESDLPDATFNFENATIDLSGPNASKWSENPPRTGTALTTLWVVRYQSINTGNGTIAARDVTFGSILEATGFEGPVTFSDFESGGRTVIDGGRIQTGSISSNGFIVGSTPTDFSTEGTKWFLEGNGQNNAGDVISEQFKITSGNASFKGDVTGASGTFGNVDLNKNGYFINATGFQLDLNGAVTIGGSKFPIPVYADDASGTNKSFTLQAGQEYVLFYNSDVPQDQLDINDVTGTWTRFVGDDGATGPAGTDGSSTFLASIYLRSASFPATPSGGSYNFGTTTLTPPSGWSITVPSGTDPLYVSTALANIEGTTGTDFTLNWSTPVIMARDGADGADGADGINGTDGADGSNGLRTATGLVFYQFGSATTPATPSASYFNFSTGDFVGLSSGWATTTPDMEAGTSNNRYHSSYYVVTETFAGSGIGSATFDTPVRAFSFNQVVTFDSLSSSGTTIINGDNITTGIISSADYVSQAGSVFSADGMAINLNSLSIETPSFAIDGNGDAYFSSGDIAIGSNKISLKAQNFYSSLGVIEFQNETGNVAADMKVTSYGTNEVTLASYKFATTKGNQLIVGEDRFFLGDANNAFVRTETISFLDYMIFNSNYYQLRGLLGTTSQAANLFMDTSNNNQLSRSTSSLKYKTDVRDYDKGVDVIKTLRPVYYKGKEDGDKQFAGLIAEEIHEAGLVEFVQYGPEGDPDALAYSNMVALLIKGMQEQQQQIDLLKSEVEALKNNTA